MFGRILNAADSDYQYREKLISQTLQYNSPRLFISLTK
jgi:hypothetical protein